MSNEPRTRQPVTGADTHWERHFAREMKRLREEKGFSLNKMARELKAADFASTAQQVDRIETGKRKIGLNEAVVIARYFGRTLSSMMGMDPYETRTTESAQRTLMHVSQGVPQLLASLESLQRSTERDEADVSEIEDWCRQHLTPGTRESNSLRDASRSLRVFLMAANQQLSQARVRCDQGHRTAIEDSDLVRAWMDGN